MNFNTARRFMETYDLQFSGLRPYAGEINDDTINPVQNNNIQTDVSKLYYLKLKDHLPLKEESVATIERISPTFDKGRIVEYNLQLRYLGDTMNILFPLEEKQQPYIDWSHIESIDKAKEFRTTIVNNRALVKRIQLDEQDMRYTITVQPSFKNINLSTLFDMFKIIPDNGDE
jgi:hypothetical protein